MKKLSTMLVISMLMSNVAFAAKCDWKNDIVEKNGSYIYSARCHHEVGVVKKDLKDREKQVVLLKKTITLKDLALTTADTRIMNWRSESYNQHERLMTQARLQSYSNWLYLGGGVVITVLAVFAAGQLK